MLPAEYLSRSHKTSLLMIRCTPDLKTKIKLSSEKNKTSMSKFILAAVEYYLDSLKNQRGNIK